MPKRAAKSSEDPLADGAIKRLVKEVTGDLRVSKLAMPQLRKAIADVLRKVGIESRKALDLSRKKTLDNKYLRAVVPGLACGLSKSLGVGATSSIHRDEKRGLAKASVERIVRKEMGDDYRISADAKVSLVAVAEYYLIIVSKAAAQMALGAKRETIQAKDVKAAVTILST